ncbi:HIT superfamily hydrolase [Nitrosotalea sinensis]|jgi:histidine triad (HIT) family protein|uniref:HIT superfamily hydrolase n=1 Tax=Nitrosotalea sinensis TaxID=1499975 RepID=A0A2H1EEH6_9ARCH|nr:HIT family protein [Candidatus Nitrosotalea sinensis]SHO43019.1 HIT superfamily hydrolase [Candidatus Nitrosotalea sinensis]
MDCIFCKIANGTIPAKKLYETEKSLAFLDAFPLAQGHTLVIPKNHYSKIQEMSKADNLDLFDTVQVMAAKLESISSSCLVAIHNGKESGQEVPHVHVHLIPRKASDGAGPVHSMFTKRPSLGSDEINDICNMITGTK